MKINTLKLIIIIIICMIYYYVLFDYYVWFSANLISIGCF